MGQHKRPDVMRRLARIEGHVRATAKMVESGRSYPEVVQQISAIRSSLDSIVEVIVEDLVEDCIKGSTSHGRGSALQLKEVIARVR
jgi:DNA-binding FrmR family transcriptional regulator